MIEEIVAELFERTGTVWKAGNEYIQPTEEDVRKVLDQVAVALYNGDDEDRLTMTGLIIEKQGKSHAVYVYVGNYE